MKELLIMMLLFILVSCKKDDKETGKVSSDIVGKWQLVEVYADPGDGSGKYRPVDSKKILEFNRDGVAKSYNGKLCGINIQSVDNEASKYMIDTVKGKDEYILIIEKCPSKMYYTVINNILTIQYQCIEGCGEKFRRVN